MKAQDIKIGMKHRVRDQKGRVIAGWTATGDAVAEGGMVYIAVKYLDGLDSAITRILDAEIEVE